MSESNIDDLKHVEWTTCLIQGERYLMKHRFMTSSYCLMLSDFIFIYLEVLSKEEVQRRSLEMNPGIEIPVERILKQLSRSIDTNTYNYCKFSIITKDSHHLQLKSESVLAEIPFLWKFCLTSSSPHFNFMHITLPLIGMICELKRRNKELGKVIKKKDNEISDHKSSGSRLTHKNLETKPFSEQQFMEDMNKSKEVAECVASPLHTVFEDNLYSVITPVVNKDRSQNHEVKEVEVEIKRPKINSSENGTEIPNTSVHDASEKDEEMKRRLLLQQQQDSKVKKQAKKLIKF